MTPIFPQITWSINKIVDLYLSTTYHIEASTKVRKQHPNGIWYATLVLERGIFTSEDRLKMALLGVVNRLNDNAYKFLLFGIIDLEAKDSFGEPIFIPTADQRSEEERLRIKQPSWFYYVLSLKMTII